MFTVATPVGVSEPAATVIVALVAVKSTIVIPDPIAVPPEAIPIAAERPGAAPVK
jgi:hypothetical protein